MPKGRSGKTVSSNYFAALYTGQEDPWNYAGSEYEAAKYRDSLAALPRRSYERALELGCSVGVFTRLLAARCRSVVAVDVSPQALIRAQTRCADLGNVRFERCDLITAFPAGAYDLVTFCELGFYFGPNDLTRIKDAIAQALVEGGHLLLVHWTPLVEGHAQTADDVHKAFVGDARFARCTSAFEENYRLNVVRRR